MLEDVVANLDRSWAALNAETSIDLVINLYRFHSELGRDTRINAIMEDLRREEAESGVLLNAAHGAIARELAEITNEMECEAPAAFPEAAESRDGYDRSLQGVRNLLTRATRTIADPFIVGKERTDSNELSHAIALLRAGADRAERTGTLDQLAELQRKFDYANRTRRIFYVTSAAASLVMIERHLLDLHPLPTDEGVEAEIARLSRVHGPLKEVAEALFGVGKPNLNDPHLKMLIEGIRSDVKRIYEDVRRRIGAERSLLALFQRYRQRCQWYDAEKLREIAARTEPSKPEDRLAETLVTYLFDHGLNPLTQPLIGKIRPDALDTHSRFSFYVEAKQYDRANVAYLLKGAWQVWDMLDQLRGTHFDVREAFYVIYRRGGPRYVFEPRVQQGDRVVHVLMIDIAPTAERGSGSPPTRTFSADDLRPKTAIEMETILEALNALEALEQLEETKSRKPKPREPKPMPTPAGGKRT